MPALIRILCAAGDPLGYEVWPEQHVRTQRSPAHYRIPDVCVTEAEPPKAVFSEPPFFCVEILPPGDAAVEVLGKIREYLAFGVDYVWIVDPDTSTGEIHSPDGSGRVEHGRFRAGEIDVQLGDL